MVLTCFYENNVTEFDVNMLLSDGGMAQISIQIKLLKNY